MQPPDQPPFPQPQPYQPTQPPYPPQAYPQPYPPGQQPEQELFRVRCRDGKLIVTTRTIRVEGFRVQKTLYRQNLVGIDYRMTYWGFFGLGALGSLTFHVAGDQFVARGVRAKFAKQIKATLGF